MKPAVGVHGLGKLGAVVAAVIADAGCDVVGVDRNEDIVDLVAARTAPVAEPGLQGLLDLIPEGRLQATSGTAWAVENTDLSMVVVPTPSLANGNFDPSYVKDAVWNIGAALRPMADDWWHTVVVCSTVSPGTMDSVVRPALEEASGRMVGFNVGLVYNPLFIALGSVISDITNPDFVLVGASDGRSQRDAFDLTAAYQATAPVCTMSFLEAEITKLAVNGYLSVKIGYANMVNAICQNLGANTGRVLDAIGADHRIGGAYLRAGGPPGGPCLPRDLDALAALAAHRPFEVPLIHAAQDMAMNVVDDIVSTVIHHDRVAILGLAYKPGTGVTERSMATDLYRCLYHLDRDFEVWLHDPVAFIEPLPREGLPTHHAERAEDAIGPATVVVIACPHPDYAHLDYGDRVVVDPWGIRS